MSRRLLAVNVALGIVSVLLAVGVFRTLLAKRPLPPPPPPRAVSAPAPAVAPLPGDGGPDAYTVVAARNLFNPSRSETPTVAAAAAPVAKPILHGVVIDGSRSRAFLEDPALKRVAGYSVGDRVGGGTIDKIGDDRVVILRPDGPLEILLQDPAKPRPAPVVAAAPGPGSPQVPVGQRGPQVAPAQGMSPPGPIPPVLPQPRQGVPMRRQPSQ
jgi:hypothetical protein